MNKSTDFMDELRKKQLKEFYLVINKYRDLDIRPFIVLYTGTFVGPYFPRDILSKTEGDFRYCCHRIVDSVNIRREEAEFFHKVIEYRPKNQDKYIEELIELYKEVEDLDKCKLADDMMKCLEASKIMTIEFH